MESDQCDTQRDSAERFREALRQVTIATTGFDAKPVKSWTPSRLGSSRAVMKAQDSDNDFKYQTWPESLNKLDSALYVLLLSKLDNSDAINACQNPLALRLLLHLGTIL